MGQERQHDFKTATVSQSLPSPGVKLNAAILWQLRRAISRQLLHPEQTDRSAFRYDASRIASCRSRLFGVDDMRNIVATAIGVVALFALANVHPVNATTPAPGDVPLVLASADIQTPSNDQVVELAERSMRIFMASVREKSMQGLWTHSSARFREKFSAAQLDKVFKNFYDLTITGDPLAGKSPIFTAGPMINEDSNLVVDGYYATTPWRVSFHLTFIMEGRSWKLVGINVSAKPPPAPDLSSPQETSGEPTFQSL
jgi:hypothetical protein